MYLAWIPLGLGLGLLLQRFWSESAMLLPWLNRYILWVAVPAIALLHLSRLQLNPTLLLPVSVAWLLFGVAWLYVLLLQRWLKLDRATTGCLILTCGLGNTSFIGYPLIQGFYGQPGLQLAVLLDQPGTFLILSTLGLLVAALYAGKRLQPTQMLRRIIGFPPFVAFCLAMLINALGWQLPDLFHLVFQGIAQTLAPAALLSVGLQIKFHAEETLWRSLGWGLLFKLGISPLLIWALYGLVFGTSGLLLRVAVLEAGMAPMITAAIVASDAGLNPRLASLMVSIGVLGALITVPLMAWMLGH